MSRGLLLLAPRFGASTYVWGGLLGTIMAALAVGYLLGGTLADRSVGNTRAVHSSTSLLGAAGSSVGALGAMRGLHGLAAASTPA